MLKKNRKLNEYLPVLIFLASIFMIIVITMIKTVNKISTANTVVLLVFNGEHDVEAENLLASIKQNAKELLPLIQVCVSDDKSKAFALRNKLAWFKMDYIEKYGTYFTYEMNFFTQRKFEAIVHVLETGKNVLYIDTDIVVLKNPLTEINFNYDLNIQNDLCKPPYDTTYLCTGFMHISANDKTISFFTRAIKEMIKANYNKFADQDALNLLIAQQQRTFIKPKNAISIKQFDVCKFPNGCRYFENSDKFCKKRQAVIVHNNYMIGVANKMQRFTKYNLLFTHDK